jgi:hypothetical protein
MFSAGCWCDCHDADCQWMLSFRLRPKRSLHSWPWCCRPTWSRLTSFILKTVAVYSSCCTLHFIFFNFHSVYQILPMSPFPSFSM